MSEKNPREVKNVTLTSLRVGEVERLHICARLAGYDSLEEFLRETARVVLQDFEAEFPGIFQTKNLAYSPGLLRVLKALQKGHMTVAAISRSLGRNPLSDYLIRTALRQLLELGVIRVVAEAESEKKAGRPEIFYELTGKLGAQ